MPFAGATAADPPRAGVGTVVRGVAGLAVRQTLLAEMQVLPQGMPLRHCF